MKRIISEISTLRQLSEMPNNKFTTKLLDVVIDPNLKDDYIFLVLENFGTDLKEMMNNTLEM
jgi:hypothetical protein